MSVSDRRSVAQSARRDREDDELPLPAPVVGGFIGLLRGIKALDEVARASA